MATVVDLTLRAEEEGGGIDFFFFKLVAVYEAVCCRVDIMICDVEREGGLHRERTGRQSEGGEREGVVCGRLEPLRRRTQPSSVFLGCFTPECCLLKMMVRVTFSSVRKSVLFAYSP